jgi:uncharacterized protein YecE (DUF72 family)
MARGAIRVGCSGWNYKHWRTLFYPEKLPQKRWFEHYSSVFDTVEINNSFYMLPSADTFAKWRDQAPPGFRYAVKANRFLTQAKKLKDCEEPLQRMMTPMRQLGDRLGPILYQLPPRLKLNLERLETFLQLVPKDVTNVFEFRERSWYVPETLDLLGRYGASFCATTCPVPPASAGPWGRSPMSASTAAKENIGAAIRTRACSPGPTGSSIRRMAAATSGATSTTTSTPTPFTTR